MKFKDFHYIMTHDEFGDNGLMNNCYFMFSLIILYIIIMFLGALGWLMILSGGRF